MTNRIRLTRPVVDTRAQAEQVLGDFALITLERNEQRIEMDRSLTAIREQYEVSITALQKQLEEKAALLNAWLDANPDELPKGRKSLELLHGVVGYRTGTPKLKTLLRKTWASVLDTIKAFGLAGQYLRVKEEPNKEALIADITSGALSEADAKKLGVRVDQEESFYIEPRLEDLSARVAVVGQVSRPGGVVGRVSSPGAVVGPVSRPGVKEAA